LNKIDTPERRAKSQKGQGGWNSLDQIETVLSAISFETVFTKPSVSKPKFCKSTFRGPCSTYESGNPSRFIPPLNPCSDSQEMTPSPKPPLITPSSMVTITLNFFRADYKYASSMGLIN